MNDSLMTVTDEKWNFEIDLMCPPDIFRPSRTSLLIAKNMVVYPDDVVLDLGTGCGLFAIVAAKLGASQVYATDIDPLEIKWGKYNTELNGVEDRTIFICGDMFKPFRDKKFDLIVSNPPLSLVPPDYLKIDTDFGQSWIPAIATNAGFNGRKYIDIIIKEASKYLRSKKTGQPGRLLIPHPSLSNIERTLKIMRKNYDVEILAEDERPFSNKHLRMIEWLRKQKEKGDAEYITRNKTPYMKVVVIYAKLKTC